MTLPSDIETCARARDERQFSAFPSPLPSPSSGASGRGGRRPFYLFAALALLRAPAMAFGVVDIDESDFVLIGRLFRYGAIPYVDVVEKKPLFCYLFYWPASLFG